jgi:hypothetical protein
VLTEAYAFGDPINVHVNVVMSEMCFQQIENSARYPACVFVTVRDNELNHVATYDLVDVRKPIVLRVSDCEVFKRSQTTA